MCIRDSFEKEDDVDPEKVLEVMEITMSNLMVDGKEPDPRDFLARADLLTASGMTVLISDFSRYYRLAAYIARYTKAKIGITMGAASLGRVFDEQYYEYLPGGILESFGRLFKNDLKLFVYPCRDRQTGAITTAETLPVCDELKKLLDYLLDRERIVGICLLYTSPSPRDLSTSRMPSSA